MAKAVAVCDKRPPDYFYADFDIACRADICDIMSCIIVKGGADDIRCTIEARPEGMQPQVVTHSDANVEAALRGGAKKAGASGQRIRQTCPPLMHRSGLRLSSRK